MEKILKFNVQLEKLKALIIKDFKNKSMYSYYVINNNMGNVFSIQDLLSFITLNDIKKSTLLNEIVNNAYAIIHIVKYEVYSDKTIEFRFCEMPDDSIQSQREYEDFPTVEEAFGPSRVKSTNTPSHRTISLSDEDFDFFENDSYYPDQSGVHWEFKDLIAFCTRILNIILKAYPEFEFQILPNNIFFDSYTYYKKDSARSIYSGSIYSHYDSEINKFPLKVLKLQDLAFKPNYPNLKLNQNDEQPGDINMLHYHIFKFNAFPIWQNMFINFLINENSRSDIKFMYEVMKEDGYIHETVSQTDLLEWVFKVHGLRIGKTHNCNKSHTRLEIYNQAIYYAN